MTDDRSLERAARSWLETGPTQAPDRAVDAALLRIQTTPQERDLRVPWRLPKMFTPARVAAAALIGVLAVGGTFVMFTRSGQPTVAGPVSTPTGSPAAIRSPAASAAASIAFVHQATPAVTWGDWQAISKTQIGSLFAANEHIQLSIDWQDGLHTWIQSAEGNLYLRSETLEAPSGEIRLLAGGTDFTGCDIGDLGRYRWSRSPDGLFLTLTVNDDACSTREAAMSRTWVHSLSAVTDGRRGVMSVEGQLLEATLPSQRFGLSGSPGFWKLADMDGPERVLVAMQDPMGIDAPCATARQPILIPPTAAGLVNYLGNVPAFTVANVAATVGGAPGYHVTLTPKTGVACPAGSLRAFHGPDPQAAEIEWSLALDEPHSLWVVEWKRRVYLFVYEGAAVTPADETTVISSLRFLDAYPTP